MNASDRDKATILVILGNDQGYILPPKCLIRGLFKFRPMSGTKEENWLKYLPKILSYSHERKYLNPYIIMVHSGHYVALSYSPFVSI